MPAATNAPNANSRMRNVSGTDSCSACAKSLSIVSLRARSALALAELLDAEAMGARAAATRQQRAPASRDRRRRRRVALQVELDERGVPVLRAHRRLELRRPRAARRASCARRARRVGMRATPPSSRVDCDEHALARSRPYAGVGQDPLRASGLAVRLLDVRQVLACRRPSRARRPRRRAAASRRSPSSSAPRSSGRRGQRDSVA